VFFSKYVLLQMTAIPSKSQRECFSASTNSCVFSFLFTPELTPAFLSGKHKVFFLLRLPDWVLAKFKVHGATTVAAKIIADAPNPGFYEWDLHCARHMLVFVLGLVYSVMGPVILPFVAAYFALAWLVAKYSFAFVFVPKWTTVRVTRFMVNRIFVSLFTFQVTMIGYLTVSLFPFTPALFAAVGGSAVVRYWMNYRYQKATKFIPLDACPEARLDTTVVDFSNFPFTHPAMVPDGFELGAEHVARHYEDTQLDPSLEGGQDDLFDELEMDRKRSAVGGVLAPGAVIKQRSASRSTSADWTRGSTDVWAPGVVQVDIASNSDSDSNSNDTDDNGP
jgi:Calcium-dependent channel, 7TM region, putative phosphate